MLGNCAPGTGVKLAAAGVVAAATDADGTTLEETGAAALGLAATVETAKANTVNLRKTIILFVFNCLFGV